MNYVNKYTSTGCKLIHHPEVIRKIQEIKRATPISIQIAPTSRCNLKCEFCSNSKRTSHEDLDFNKLCSFLKQMKSLGAKTIEWTGGGDPTQYKNINEGILKAKDLGFKQGFITNGVALDVLDLGSLKNLHWIRISMNGLDYGKTAIMPDKKHLNGTLGFSYVMNDKTTPDILKELDVVVKRSKPSYVRIVPNCLVSKEQQLINNKELGEKVKLLGNPYFFQDKVFKKPWACWWYLFKPFLLHDGWIYPCSSIVLNDTADRQFHDKYRVSEMGEFYKLYHVPMVGRSSENCTHCVFCDQNELVSSIVNTTDMEDFV